MSTKTSLGIDLGTTNSTASKMSNGRIEEFSFPGEGPQLLSAVSFPDEEGKKELVGQKAFRAAYKNPENLFTHFKRRMYDAATDPVYGGRTAIMLFALILQGILNVVRKSDPEIAQYLDGTKLREELVVTITHPANWGVQQQDWLRDAGRLAGIEIDAFIPEPVAAAYRLLEEKSHRIQQNNLLAIVDFGGGTLDCTVHQWDQGKLDTVVGATGDPLLGGDNVTGVLFQNFSDVLKLKVGECFNPERGLDLAHPSLKTHKIRRIAIELWKVSAEAKEQLSTTDSATVFFNGKSGPEELSLTADEYDDLTKEIWVRFDAAIANMLADSNYQWADIDLVGIAGGSAMARGVLKHVSDITGKPESEILLSSNSSHVVASGAAIAGFNDEETDSHIGRGLGIRMLTSLNGSKSYTNKMLMPTNTIVKAGGENFQDTGQRITSNGGKSLLKLQFVEAKPAVVVPSSTDGIPSLLDDSEVNRLQTITREIDVPAGEHEVLCGFSISNGSIHSHLSFPSLPAVEAISGRLSSSHEESQEEPQQSVDLVIMQDISGSMEGDKMKNSKVAIENVVSQSSSTDVRLSIVTFGLQTGVLCPFGTTAKKTVRAVRKLEPNGGTPMTEAFELAIGELRSQRSHSHKLAIIVTDGHPHNSKAAEVAATELKKGAELICFGIGSDVDDGYLTRLATSSQHYFSADDPQQIPVLFDNIMELFLN